MAETEPANAAPAATRTVVLAVIVVVLAAGLAALSWLDARHRIATTQEEIARRLREIESDAREARLVSRQAQEALRESQSRLAQIEGRVAESQSQSLALEALYQDLSRNRDEWQLAEIEQVLAIASQQLQLARNVRAALLALQLADSRLARTDRPQFAPIRRALARDIERLKAAPAVDFAAVTARIDNLIAGVDGLPLAFDERTERAAAAKDNSAADRSFVGRLGAEVWSEISELVDGRRRDAADPPLLPPSQAYFVRENLRLRLLNARASLLARDEAGYREDLRASQAWVQRYFDADSKTTTDAAAQLKQLSAVSISFEMPTISESLDAVRGYKSRRERSSG